ncbi:hypothetical protein M501DRAFT_1012837 [Patellaria atrata CBS 101060]|uniref:Uncharacterized protein n=1 Tax=Patellaria atrata CBS 101060 TaxID=1346257 RepID=A0A9P4SJ38_9PEZI|nr:hypothetical protein M501DRAFT_1012837 [Patellaria atrata CBS 101060]
MAILLKFSKFIVEISQYPNIKICVSSRLWPEFEDTFNLHPWLRLEDLTHSDIQLFLSENLNRNMMFATLQDESSIESARPSLEITEKASGVFLWVRLVVNSLLEGIREGDKISILLQRLRALPEDLEMFFQHIIEDLTDSHREEASRLFQVVDYARDKRPSTLIELSFLEEGSEAAIAADIVHLPYEKLKHTQT